MGLDDEGLNELRNRGDISEQEYEALVAMRISEQIGASPPPPPPPSKKKQRRFVLVFVSLGLLCLFGGIVLFLLLEGDSKEAQTLRVNYSIEVITDEYCADFFDGGYSDIPFSDVEVFDGRGNLLGFGPLNGGVDTSDSCLFSADFEVGLASDGQYRVTVGNQNRGFLNYSDSDIDDGELIVESVLGR